MFTAVQRVFDLCVAAAAPPLHRLAQWVSFFFAIPLLDSLGWMILLLLLLLLWMCDSSSLFHSAPHTRFPIVGWVAEIVLPRY